MSGVEPHQEYRQYREYRDYGKEIDDMETRLSIAEAWIERAKGFLLALSVVASLPLVVALFTELSKRQ